MCCIPLSLYCSPHHITRHVTHSCILTLVGLASFLSFVSNNIKLRLVITRLAAYNHPRPCPCSVAQAPPTQTWWQCNTCVIVRAVPSLNPPSSSSSSTCPCPYPCTLAPPHSNSATVQYVHDCMHCTVIEPLVVIVLTILALVSPLSSPSLRRTSPLRLSDGATCARLHVLCQHCAFKLFLYE